MNATDPAEAPDASRRLEPASHFPDLIALREEEALAGVLRWLLVETEAEAVAYLSLGPSGREDLRIEPRGLHADLVGDLAARARRALTEDPPSSPAKDDVALTRWLGVGGTKALALRSGSGEVRQAMRLARFGLEWLLASRPGTRVDRREQRARRIPGVLWAEVAEEPTPALRVLLTPTGNPDLVRRAAEDVAEGLAIRVERSAEAESSEPRARLVDVVTDVDGRATADVVLDWRGQKLRGRGLGRATEAGRVFAAAQAVADAMKPLIEGDLDIEAVFEAVTPEQGDLLVVAVRVADQRFVGAVVSKGGEQDVSGARAVLDALNRRLPHIAGRSGRV